MRCVRLRIDLKHVRHISRVDQEVGPCDIHGTIWVRVNGAKLPEVQNESASNRAEASDVVTTTSHCKIDVALSRHPDDVRNSIVGAGPDDRTRVDVVHPVEDTTSRVVPGRARRENLGFVAKESPQVLDEFVGAHGTLNVSKSMMF